MGMYESHSYRNYPITKEQYNYLLPIWGLSDGFGLNPRMRRLFEGKNKNRETVYMFMGNENDYKDMLNRIKYLD